MMFASHPAIECAQFTRGPLIFDCTFIHILVEQDNVEAVSVKISEYVSSKPLPTGVVVVAPGFGIQALTRPEVGLSLLQWNLEKVLIKIHNLTSFSPLLAMLWITTGPHSDQWSSQAYKTHAYGWTTASVPFDLIPQHVRVPHIQQVAHMVLQRAQSGHILKVLL